jgi:hypothetical protein
MSLSKKISSLISRLDKNQINNLCATNADFCNMFNIPSVAYTKLEIIDELDILSKKRSTQIVDTANRIVKQISTEVWIVRVADIDPVSSNAAETASVDVLSAGGAVTILGNGTTPFTFGDIDGDGIVDDRMFRWRLNGVLSQKTLVVLADNNRPSPYTGVAYTAALLVDTLNSQLTDEDGIEFYVSGTKIGVRTTFSFGPTATLELVACRNSLYGPGISINAGSGARVFTNPAVGLGLSMYPAQVVSNGQRNRRRVDHN